MNETPKADWKAILAIILCGIVFAIWQNNQFKKRQAFEAAAKKQAAVAASNGKLAMSSAAPGTTSTAMAAGSAGTASVAVATAAPSATPTPKPAEIVTLSNKVLDLVVSSNGARPIRADLKQYKNDIDASNDTGLVQLVATSNEGIAPLQAWWGDANGSRIPQDATFEKVRESENEAVFRYTAPDGLTLTRTYSTTPEDYLVNVTEEFSNAGKTTLSGKPGLVWSANLRGSKASRALGDFEAIAEVADRTQRGVPGGRRFTKFFFMEAGDPKETWTYTGKVDFVACDDRYFVAAAIPLDPPFDGENSAKIWKPGEHSVASLALGPETKLDPGGSRLLKYQLYLGPKDFLVLKAAGHGLEETIYWGQIWMEPISKGFWYLFRFIHNFVPNWGLSIIVLTFVLRGLLWPLAGKQIKMSQEFAGKSQKLKPQLDQLKKKFADDPMKLNSETMLLYKQHGLSPFSPMMGCLPMLIQLPIWWALYKVLWYSIDLRQQPLGLWIHDLAAPDPYKVLPILLGVVTFVQTKLTPQAPGTDPSQQKMMLYTMPILFSVLMFSLPSGLVLYIFTSTLMNIVQQYYLRRKYPVGTTPVLAQTKEAT